jgi:hypothetical protein
LLKIEVEFFIQIYIDTHGKLPTNDAIQLDACRVIFAAEASVDTELHSLATTQHSWLRDLIMSSEQLATQARFGPLRTASESRHSQLKANGKDHLFEQCPLEESLRAFVLEQQLLGGTITETQLQTQMCEIIRQLEAVSTTPSDMFANWLVKGIYSSPVWLAGFKQRAGTLDTFVLPGHVADTEAQQASDDWTVLMASSSSPFNSLDMMPTTNPMTTFMPQSAADEGTASTQNMTIFDMNGRPTVLLSADTNFHRVFESDIKRWVAATMSPKNPNCHVPSDAEIQHQGRWIMYGEDDPWNQTPADIAEWLWRFKRDVGITSDIDVVNPAELTRHQL